ncbi:hypothetical protein OHS70_04955 [Streptomyces sp. NBC_00390]|uniref:WD40/YVTN/BNR-like repeat-containing protein n=1 Tax=Streptomyces sp. NBC_00390 TaxID=2975736 RepID=UPI002E201FDB
MIESTDSGKTWRTRSFAGEADFHSLDYAHGTIYRYDSTNALLRVSKDGATWVARASLQALDIAVSPDDPDTGFATTADGVAKSTDGGRTFAPGKQPMMAFLSWVTPEALYGIDDSGTLSRCTDGGSTWAKAGSVPGGQAQALTAVDDQHILAATQSGVYESRDGGKTSSGSRSRQETATDHHAALNGTRRKAKVASVPPAGRPRAAAAHVR